MPSFWTHLRGSLSFERSRPAPETHGAGRASTETRAGEGERPTAARPHDKFDWAVRGRHLPFAELFGAVKASWSQGRGESVELLPVLKFGFRGGPLPDAAAVASWLTSRPVLERVTPAEWSQLVTSAQKANQWTFLLELARKLKNIDALEPTPGALAGALFAVAKPVRRQNDRVHVEILAYLIEAGVNEWQLRRLLPKSTDDPPPDEQTVANYVILARAAPPRSLARKLALDALETIARRSKEAHALKAIAIDLGEPELARQLFWSDIRITREKVEVGVQIAERLGTADVFKGLLLEADRLEALLKGLWRSEQPALHEFGRRQALKSVRTWSTPFSEREKIIAIYSAPVPEASEAREDNQRAFAAEIAGACLESYDDFHRPPSPNIFAAALAQFAANTPADPLPSVFASRFADCASRADGSTFREILRAACKLDQLDRFRPQLRAAIRHHVLTCFDGDLRRLVATLRDLGTLPLLREGLVLAERGAQGVSPDRMLAVLESLIALGGPDEHAFVRDNARQVLKGEDALDFKVRAARLLQRCNPSTEDLDRIAAVAAAVAKQRWARNDGLLMDAVELQVLGLDHARDERLEAVRASVFALLKAGAASKQGSELLRIAAALHEKSEVWQAALAPPDAQTRPAPPGSRERIETLRAIERSILVDVGARSNDSIARASAQRLALERLPAEGRRRLVERLAAARGLAPMSECMRVLDLIDPAAQIEVLLEHLNSRAKTTEARFSIAERLEILSHHPGVPKRAAESAETQALQIYRKIAEGAKFPFLHRREANHELRVRAADFLAPIDPRAAEVGWRRTFEAPGDDGERLRALEHLIDALPDAADPAQIKQISGWVRRTVASDNPTFRVDVAARLLAAGAWPLREFATDLLLQLSERGSAEDLRAAEVLAQAWQAHAALESDADVRPSLDDLRRAWGGIATRSRNLATRTSAVFRLADLLSLETPPAEANGPEAEEAIALFDALPADAWGEVLANLDRRVEQRVALAPEFRRAVIARLEDRREPAAQLGAARALARFAPEAPRARQILERLLRPEVPSFERAAAADALLGLPAIPPSARDLAHSHLEALIASDGADPASRLFAAVAAERHRIPPQSPRVPLVLNALTEWPRDQALGEEALLAYVVPHAAQLPETSPVLEGLIGTLLAGRGPKARAAGADLIQRHRLRPVDTRLSLAQLVGTDPQQQADLLRPRQLIQRLSKLTASLNLIDPGSPSYVHVSSIDQEAASDVGVGESAARSEMHVKRLLRTVATLAAAPEGTSRSIWMQTGAARLGVLAAISDAIPQIEALLESDPPQGRIKVVELISAFVNCESAQAEVVRSVVGTLQLAERAQRDLPFETQVRSLIQEAKEAAFHRTVRSNGAHDATVLRELIGPVVGLRALDGFRERHKEVHQEKASSELRAFLTQLTPEAIAATLLERFESPEDLRLVADLAAAKIKARQVSSDPVEAQAALDARARLTEALARARADRPISMQGLTSWLADKDGRSLYELVDDWGLKLDRETGELKTTRSTWLKVLDAMGFMRK